MGANLGKKQGNTKKAICYRTLFILGVNDGIRTHDPWNHNPML